MNLVSRILVLALLLFAMSTSSFGQIAAGAPIGQPFGTFGAGTFDSVNLANLNVHFSIPILSKPGRGPSFTYALGYDNSIWYPLTTGSTTNWQPIQNWGWITETEAATGTLDYLFVYGCAPPFGCAYEYLNYLYIDPFGAPHPFSFTYNGYYVCNGQSYGPNPPPSCPSSDGSGYSLVANFNVPPYTGIYTILNPQGKSTVPTVNQNTGTAGFTDANGNQISVSGSGVFTDTLGTSALTVGGVAPSNTTFQYTDPNGQAQQYTMKYAQTAVRTAFGCTNVIDYSGTQYLVSEIDLPDQGSVPSDKYTFTYEPTPGFSGYYTGRIASVTLPTGGTITYTYSGGDHNTGIWCADGSTATLTRQTPDGTWTYAHSESGTAWTTNQTDPQGNLTVMKFQGIYQTESDAYQGSSTLLETTYTCYNGSAGPPCNSTAVTTPIARKTAYIQWPSGLELKTDTFYDTETCGSQTCTNGLVTEVDEYDNGTSGPGSLLRKSIIKYATLGNNIVGKPLSITVCSPGGTASACNNAGTVVAQTTYTYDGTSTQPSGISTQHVSVSGSRGNLTQVSQYVSSSSSVTQNFTNFDTGMVDVAYDGKNNSTTYAYSSTYVGAYPTTITNALNQVRTNTYNINSGLLTSTKDANNQTTTFAYDLMFRPTQVNYPDSGQTTFLYGPQYGGYYVRETAKMDNSGHNLVSYLWSDGLGRPARAAATNGETQPYDETRNICFNSSGLVSLQGYPFQDGGWNAPISCSVAGDSYTYDALGRPTRITHADSSYATVLYSANCATVTDEQGKTRQTCADGLGRLTSVTENPGGLNYTTTYTYDVLNNLTGVTQNGSHSRSFAYDGLSRLKSAANPESGTTTYTYDNASNLATRTDARNITTTYTYDALNRLTRKTYSDGTIQANFQYDATSNWGVTLSNTVGRLSEEWTGTSSNPTATIFSYDSMGRVISRILCTPSYCPSQASSRFSLNDAYDFIGDTTSYTNGEGVTFTQNFNVGGRPTQVTSSLVDSQHPGTLTSGVHYNGAGAFTSYAFGNGLTQTAVFDGLLQPCRMNVNSSGTLVTSCTQSAPTGNVLDLSIGFNYGSADNGNVMSWAAAGQQTFNRTYTYDALNRLSTMSAPGSTCTGLSWNYDAWGNRTDQNYTGGTCLTFHQSASTNNQFNSSPYTYDAAGNMTHDASHSYFYDAENRIIQVDGTLGTCSTATACFVYDAEGTRWEKSSSTGWRDYLHDVTGHVITEVISTGWNTGYIYLGDSPLAEYRNSTTYFVHLDHLGSTRLLTGYPTPSIAECDDYYPFGELISCGGTSTDPHKFTGYERDTESNLDNAQARYYGSTLGRFMSADPTNAGADPANPQSWNMYAYVNNTPVTTTDPTGLCGDDGTGCGSGDCFEMGDCENPDCGFSFCLGPSGPDYPVVTAAGGSGPPPFSPPGSNSILSCNPYQSCPRIYFPPGLPPWFGLPSSCDPWWHMGQSSPCIMSAFPNGWCFDSQMRLYQCNIETQTNCTDKTEGACTTTVVDTMAPPPPKPRSFWDKIGQTMGCIAGMDPEYAKQDAGWGAGEPAPATDIPEGHPNGQRTVHTPQRTRGYNPTAASAKIDKAVGSVQYGASVSTCVANVWAKPKKN
jgi:RHS repeat-associated protein